MTGGAWSRGGRTWGLYCSGWPSRGYRGSARKRTTVKISKSIPWGQQSSNNVKKIWQDLLPMSYVFYFRRCRFKKKKKKHFAKNVTDICFLAAFQLKIKERGPLCLMRRSSTHLDQGQRVLKTVAWWGGRTGPGVSSSRWSGGLETGTEREKRRGCLAEGCSVRGEQDGALHIKMKITATDNRSPGF